MSDTLEKALNELTYSINRLEGLWRLNYENSIKQQAEGQSFLVDHQKRMEQGQKEGHEEVLAKTGELIDKKISEHMVIINKMVNDQLKDITNAFSQTALMLEQKLATEEEKKRMSDSFVKRLFKK